MSLACYCKHMQADLCVVTTCYDFAQYSHWAAVSGAMTSVTWNPKERCLTDPIDVTEALLPANRSYTEAVILKLTARPRAGGANWYNWNRSHLLYCVE